MMKLVRDKCPELKTEKPERLKGTAYRVALQQRLLATAENYQKAETDRKAVQELVDLVELVHALLPAHNMTFEELEMVRRRKKTEQGAFDQGQAIPNTSLDS